MTWTVTDASGNTATCSFDVTVNDTQNPTITCVTDQTRNTNNGVCTYTVVGTEFNPTAFADNCTGSTISNDYNSSSTLAGAIFPKGTTTVTWTVTDASGNTATCSFDVTVNDNQNPTITCVTDQTRNANNGVCTYTVVGTEFNPTAFADNCTGSTISNDYNSSSTLAGAIFPKGTTTVTWTVTDASGNTATCSFDVTVNDTQNPTITCVTDQTRNANNGVCTYTVVGTEFNPTAFADNCTGSTISNDYNSSSTLAGAIFPKGTTTVTWTVTDASGNTATCSFDVTVNDTQNPTITCVTDQTRNANNGVCTYTVVGTEFNPTAFADNCTGSTISNDYNSSSTLAGAIFPKGTTTVTWTVTDASGNTATCSFDVTVNDTQNPTITCVTDQTRNANNGVCTYTVVGTEFNPTAFADNCTGATISNDYNSGSTLAGAIFPKGTTTVTWTVTDASGNTATCSFDVTVNDTQNPTITCVTDQTRNANNGVCTYTVVGTEFNPTAFADNCTGATISNDYNSSSTLAGAIFPKGTTTVTWTVTDASGNTATCSFDVTVNDNQNPTITCVTDQTRDANNGVCTYTVVGTEFNPTAFADNCIGSTISNDYNSSSTLAGAIFPKGTTTVTWTVTDASGNTATCSFDVTVNDNQDPTISCIGKQVRIADAGVCTYTAVGTEFDPITFADNCTGATISNDYNSSSTLAGAIFPKGTTTITWTVTDASGNTASCSFDLTVNDDQNPTIVCPGDIFQMVDPGQSYATVITPDPVISDNCAISTLTWSMSGVMTGSSPATGINFLGTLQFNLGVTTVTYVLTDAEGNSSSCSYTVTVGDNIPPTITCPENISQNVDPGVCFATVINPDPVITDNGVIVLVTWTMSGATTGASPATGINYVGTQSFNVGVTTITYYVEDGGGNSNTCSYTVTVTDNINPVVICPSDINQSSDAGVCYATITPANPATSDNCTVVQLTWNMSGATTGNSPATGMNYVGIQQFNKGITTITYTVTDASGNTGTCSFTVTVNDTENPTIACVANQTRNANNGVCTYTAIGTEFDPTAFSDNCLGSTISNDFNNSSSLAGAIFPKGTTTVTWTVTDASNNTATCSFTLTVNDNQNPTITCVTDQTRNANNGACTYTTVGTEFDPTAYADNCTGSTISNDYNNGSTLAGAIFPKGTTTVIWTVTDASNNTATCSFTVTVTDNQNPTITCVGDQTRSTNAGVCTYTAVGTEFDPTAFGDNCTGSTISNDYNSGSTLAGAIFPKGTTTVTWTVTDASGNTATCSFDVTVNDNEDPTIACVGNQVRNTDAGVCTYTTVGTEFDPTAFADNCTGSSISNDYNNGSSLQEPSSRRGQPQ